MAIADSTVKRWLHKPTGQWCKKAGGTRHYFGTYHNEAVKRYREFLAGKPKRKRAAKGPTMRDLCNKYLEFKQERVDDGDLSPQTFRDCHRVCNRLRWAKPTNANPISREFRRLLDDACAHLNIERDTTALAQLWQATIQGSLILAKASGDERVIASNLGQFKGYLAGQLATRD